MASATLNLKVSPRRILSAREAADYCGLPVKRFPVVCSVSPVQLPTGAKAYDIQDLDDWIDRLKSDLPNDDDIIRRLDG